MCFLGFIIGLSIGGLLAVVVSHWAVRREIERTHDLRERGEK